MQVERLEHRPRFEKVRVFRVSHKGFPYGRAIEMGVCVQRSNNAVDVDLLGHEKDMSDTVLAYFGLCFLSFLDESGGSSFLLVA